MCAILELLGVVRNPGGGVSHVNPCIHACDVSQSSSTWKFEKLAFN